MLILEKITDFAGDKGYDKRYNVWQGVVHLTTIRVGMCYNVYDYWVSDKKGDKCESV